MQKHFNVIFIESMAGAFYSIAHFFVVRWYCYHRGHHWLIFWQVNFC
jgi:hypothetical protein